MVRRAILVLLVAVICGVVTGTLGCGGGSEPSATITTTIDAAATRIMVIQDYKNELEDWAVAYVEGADIHALDDLQHPLYPTEEELKRARDFTAYTRRMLSALREIDPPPDIAQAHYQYVDSIAAEIRALDRLLLGLESGNERDMQLAFRDASAAYQKELQALRTLSPYIDLPGLTQN
jgi:hypothetical protein